MEKNGTGGGADAAIAIQKGAITPK